MNDPTTRRTETLLRETLGDPVLDAGAPDVAEVLAGVRAAVPDTGRPRRPRSGLVVATAVAAVLAVVVGTVLLVGRDGPTADAPVAGDGSREVTVYLLDTTTGALAPRTVSTPDTGDAAVDALTALLAEQPTGAEVANPLRFLLSGDRVLTSVSSVAQADGVVTVDLADDLADPFPTVDYVCTEEGGHPYCPPDPEPVQQLVWTVTTALGTDDPVRFTADGEPMTSVWGAPARGPVAPDPAALRPAGTDGDRMEVEVPEVVGRSRPEARRVLDAAGLDLLVRSRPCPPTADCVTGVFRQRPVAGAVVPAGTTVVVRQWR